MHEYLIQIIATGILIFTLPVIKYISKKLIRKYAIISKKLENRTNHIVRIFAIILNFFFLLTIIVIWGVEPHNLLVAMSSIFAIIGVAMFAQWSMLSNVTAGILIFFTAPFRTGDYIRILDKDLAFDAHVEDILTFHTKLRNREGELISYPNSLFFQKGVSILHTQSWDDEVAD